MSVHGANGYVETGDIENVEFHTTLADKMLLVQGKRNLQGKYLG
jgi:hypothetical protein